LAATRIFGPWGGTLLLTGAVVSMFGYVSGMTLAVPRALYAFARDGFLPRALARIHPASARRISPSRRRARSCACWRSPAASSASPSWRIS